MKLRFPESKIQHWADRNEPWGRIAKLETEFLTLRPKIQKRSYLKKDELQKIAYWKSPRTSGYIQYNDADYIRDITYCAFTATNERARIRVLSCLDGVGLPSASAILHLFHKDDYPIYDFRALWSIGEQNDDYSFSFWWDYVEFCRDVANRNKVDMRTLDKALWQYSKENQ